MITRIRGGRLIVGDTLQESYLYFCDGKITAITGEELPFDREIDAGGRYVSPGFIDIHVHGGAGHEFIDATAAAIIDGSAVHARQGTTTLFPTLSAFSYEKTVAALSAIRHYRDKALPHMPGVHLEGPYFSPQQCGAQDPASIRLPDKAEYEKLWELFGSLIARWSYAPELAGAVPFQQFLQAHGIVGSAGHTDATLADMQAVLKNGCNLITHLYSCTSTVTRRGGFRYPGVIESAYLLDDMSVEAIADGCHLPPALLQLIYKIKGAAHMCLVTDAIRFGGMAEREGMTAQSGSVSYLIEDGVAKLADRSAFAGSIATCDRLLRTCVKRAGIPLTAAVRMLTATPAAIMHLPHKGTLREGYDADVVIFDDDICIKKVIIDGKEIV